MGPSLVGALSQTPTAQSRQFDKKTITFDSDDSSLLELETHKR